MDTLKALDEFKEKHGLTNECLGKVIGFAASSLRRWRAGENVPEWVGMHLDTIGWLTVYQQRRLIKKRTED